MELNNSIGVSLKMINNMIARRMSKYINKENMANISVTQARILHYLIINNNKRIYQKDIEEMLNFRRSTISGILKTMEKNDMIKRSVSKNDSRSKEIILTNKAKSEAFEMSKKAKDFDKVLMQNIDSKDLETFFKVMNQIQMNIIEDGSNFIC